MLALSPLSGAPFSSLGAATPSPPTDHYPLGPYPLRQGAALWLQHGAEPPEDPLVALAIALDRSRFGVANRLPRYPRAPYPLRQGARSWAHHGAEPPEDATPGLVWRLRRVSPLLPQAFVRASQIAVQCLVRADGVPVRASQLTAAALLRANAVPVRASQALVQALVRANLVPPRAAQFLAQVLVWSHTVSTSSLAVFPTLPGLAFDVVKRPTFYTASAKSVSGYSVRIGYADTPTWEWDLTYEVLKDTTSTSDLKKLLGFWLGMQGDLRPFLFSDPDDNAVAGQLVGTGDGSTTTFTLYRTYGSGQTGTEPIGYVDTSGTFNVYVNGTVVDPSLYTVVQSTPYGQQIKFTTAPASGATVTADFSFYYYVHFKDASNEFEKFMNKFWSMKKLTLESLRG